MLYGKQLINNHSYLFDTVSGALIEKSSTVDKS